MLIQLFHTDILTCTKIPPNVYAKKQGQNYPHSTPLEAGVLNDGWSELSVVNIN